MLWSDCADMIVKGEPQDAAVQKVEDDPKPAE